MSALPSREVLEALRGALERPGEPGAAFALIDRWASGPVGHALFTAMRFHKETMEVERLFSTNHAAYPLAGRKPKRDTEWGRHVLIERRVFVGEGEAAIGAAFDDHATILGLGLRSVANVPVTFAGRCLGTLNFLATRPVLGTEAEAAARLAALLATPLYLALPQ